MIKPNLLVIGSHCSYWQAGQLDWISRGGLLPSVHWGYCDIFQGNISEQNRALLRPEQKEEGTISE